MRLFCRIIAIEFVWEHLNQFQNAFELDTVKKKNIFYLTIFKAILSIQFQSFLLKLQNWTENIEKWTRIDHVSEKNNEKRLELIAIKYVWSLL